jgi:dTDP-4-amino-4,6-dideoxygalactose transaminase
LQRLESILKNRDAVAREYHQRLAGHPGLKLPLLDAPRGRISWFVYVVRLGERFTQNQRDWIWAEMTSRGIGCGRYFAPIHWQPVYKRHTGSRHELPNTEWSAVRSLALPFFNNLKPAEIDEVCQTLQELMRAVLD